MQIFGNDEVKENSVVVGGCTVKVKKASSLAEGAHSARFYPLSPDFYKGADYISIVQYFHWLNRKPCICRGSSYDYSVPDVQNKAIIDVSCVICNDKFALFKQGKAVRDSNPAEADRLKQLGKDLAEKVSASSLVSLTDASGNLLPPVILRYTKELLDQLEMHAKRVFDGTGIHLCDPVKGFMFDIIIGKNEGGFRTYKNSMPSVDMRPVDITGAPWKWDEICESIRAEIKPIPSVDEVTQFYLNSYSGAQEQKAQMFTHPNFQSNVAQANSISNVANSQNSNGAVQFVPPSNNQENASSFVPPTQKAEIPPTPSFAPPVSNTGSSNPVPTFSAPGISAKPPAEIGPVVDNTSAVKALLPCHAELNGSGYSENDAVCKTCDQAETCFNARVRSDNKAAINPVSSSVHREEAFNAGDIQAKLDVLSKSMQKN